MTERPSPTDERPTVTDDGATTEDLESPQELYRRLSAIVTERAELARRVSSLDWKQELLWNQVRATLDPESLKRLPGATWRILAKDDKGAKVELENIGIFDELVIDDWLHLEQMNKDSWWIRVGDASINVHIQPDGKVAVAVERGVY